MFSQADINTIATVFGKKTDEISSAISQEGEISLDLRLPGKIYTSEEIEGLKTSIRGAGVEIGLKQVAKTFGVDLNGEDKTPELVAEKIKTTISTEFEEKYKNMTPSEEVESLRGKVTEWEQKYNKLNRTYEDTQKLIQDKEQAYNGLLSDIREKEYASSVISFIPDKALSNLKKLGLTNNDAISIIKSRVKAEEVEGKLIHKKGDEVITDAIGNPETTENVVKSLVEELGWIKTNGMGGTDQGGARSYVKGLTPEQAHKKLIADGIEPGSARGLELFNQMISK